MSVMREVSAFQASTLRMPIERRMKTSPIGAMASVVRILLLTIVFGAVAGVFIWQGLIGRERELLQEIDRLEDEMAAEVAHRDEMIDRLGRTSRLARVEILDQTRVTPEIPIPSRPPGCGSSNSTRMGPNWVGATTRSLETCCSSMPGRFGSNTSRSQAGIPSQVEASSCFEGSIPTRSARWTATRSTRPEAFRRATPSVRRLATNAHSGAASGDWPRIPEEARRMGVRVAQGEAVYKPVRTGQRYDLVAESAGGLTMVPIDDDQADDQFAVVPTDD